MSAKALVEIAVTVLGLSYISGFLVTYTFQSRLGIHDANAELLRIRYMHTGLLCLAFPLFVVTPIAAHLWMLFEQRRYETSFQHAAKSNKVVGKSHLSYTIQLFCITMVLCVYVLFEPYGEFHSHLHWIVPLLGLVVLQLSIGRKLVGFSAKKEQTLVRYGLALASLILGYLSVRGTVPYLSAIAGKSTSYLIFIISLSYYLAHSLPAKLEFWYPGQREGIYLARWAMTATLAILAILTFAFRVYPYIPADKGGGNFKYSGDAVICVLPKGVLPQNIQDPKNPGCTAPLKLIELTDTVAYAARIDDAGKNEIGQAPPPGAPKGPAVWSDGYFPSVYAVSRENIAFIAYSTGQ